MLADFAFPRSGGKGRKPFTGPLRDNSRPVFFNSSFSPINLFVFQNQLPKRASDPTMATLMLPFRVIAAPKNLQEVQQKLKLWYGGRYPFILRAILVNQN